MAETASMTEETPRKIRRKRNRNFSVDEENIIQSLVKSNSQVLHDKLSSEVTNKKKSAIWMAITKTVDMKDVALRSVDEVKEKWSNMTRKAKKTFTDYRLQQRKTGGVPPPSEPSQAISRIIEIMQDSASFSGISRGLESEILPSVCNI
ncbi:nuclear apoptosis-inducing factor 1-like [Haliotis cracherodii]|uniref:nuclear apoptosis-inducing factor 1-like n=1 Tax=Haliotis cracherodii TaxID=6455 RepID=UPI0039E949B3